jgi:hypothetical protein
VGQVPSQRGPVGIPEELAAGSALGTKAVFDLRRDVVDVDRSAFDAGSEITLENGVDERAPIGRGDGLDLTRVFEFFQVEHMAEEVAERTGRPPLQRCRRARMLEVVRELWPATDSSRPPAELAGDPCPRRRESALEPGRADHRQLLDRPSSRARGQQVAYVELGGGRGLAAAGQPPFERRQVDEPRRCASVVAQTRHALGVDPLTEEL